MAEEPEDRPVADPVGDDDHPSGAGARSPLVPASADCPFCGEARSELLSPFGSALSVATYWCLSCRTAFEVLKWRDREEE